MKKQNYFATFTAVISLGMGLAGSADAALVGRLAATPGGTDYQAYYDDVADLTWAANANINGLHGWSAQQAWVAGLTIGGVSGWRLPSMDVNGDGVIVNCNGGGVPDCIDNEMGFLSWENGITTADPGVFSNVGVFTTGRYWSGTDDVLDSANAWVFDFTRIFGSNFQAPGGKDFNNFLAWAVRSGDVAVVPVPAAAWLFGSGLLGLVGVARRKK